MLKHCIWMIALVFALTGCASSAPISANPVQDISTGVLAKARADLGLAPSPFDIGTGLKEAAYNLDGAVSVGITDQRIIAARDCVHGVLKQLGLEEGQAAGASFIPKDDTIIGKGSVLFIRAVQLADATGQGIQVPSGCQAQIGQFVLDAAAQGKSLLPGGGLLPTFKP